MVVIVVRSKYSPQIVVNRWFRARHIVTKWQLSADVNTNVHTRLGRCLFTRLCERIFSASAEYAVGCVRVHKWSAHNVQGHPATALYSTHRAQRES